MIGRRGLLAGLAATMSWRGGDPGPAGMRGGLPQPRFDQIHNPPIAPAGQVGGAAGTLRARRVVVFGTSPNLGIFVYNGQPAHGNLVLSITNGPGTDPYGNAYLQEITVFEGGSISANYFGRTIELIGFFSETLLITPDGGFSGYLDVPKLAVNGGASGQDQLEVTGSISATLSLFLAERGSPPATPSGGGRLYVNAGGDLHYKGPAGTDTMIAPA